MLYSNKKKEYNIMGILSPNIDLERISEQITTLYLIQQDLNNLSMQELVNRYIEIYDKVYEIVKNRNTINAELFK